MHKFQYKFTIFKFLNMYKFVHDRKTHLFIMNIIKLPHNYSLIVFFLAAQGVSQQIMIVYNNINVKLKKTASQCPNN
jgi:hypothetical protein